MFEYFNISFNENYSHDIDFNFDQLQLHFNNTAHAELAPRILCVFYVVLFIVGIPANSFVIYVYAKDKKRIKYTKFSFINLSISDLLILLLCIPISINDVLYPNEWFFGKTYCKLIFKFVPIFFK
jgi:hypothetical protein